MWPCSSACVRATRSSISSIRSAGPTARWRRASSPSTTAACTCWRPPKGSAVRARATPKASSRRCAVSSLYDFIVVDAGSTLTESAVAALTMSDVVMLVANPDVPCLRNLQRLTDALRLAGVAPERVRIVLNRTSENGVLPVGQIEEVLGRTIDFQVPSDYRTVAAAVNTGVPVSWLRTTELQLQIDRWRAR